MLTIYTTNSTQIKRRQLLGGLFIKMSMHNQAFNVISNIMNETIISTILQISKMYLGTFLLSSYYFSSNVNVLLESAVMASVLCLCLLRRTQKGWSSAGWEATRTGENILHPGCLGSLGGLQRV